MRIQFEAVVTSCFFCSCLPDDKGRLTPSVFVVPDATFLEFFLGILFYYVNKKANYLRYKNCIELNKLKKRMHKSITFTTRFNAFEVRTLGICFIFKLDNYELETHVYTYTSEIKYIQENKESYESARMTQKVNSFF